MKSLKYIVFICTLLLSEWMVAGTSLVSTDPNWLGGMRASSTTESNDFWLTFMHNASDDPTQPEVTFEMQVIVSAREEMDIVIAAGNTPLRDVHINAGETQIVTFDYNELIYLYESEVQKYKGVHVYSKENSKDKFFSCFLYNRIGSTAGSSRDASIVLPTRTLGKEYIIQTYPEDLQSTQFAIIATEDNTDVQIVPTFDTYKKAKAGTTITLNKLKAGEAYLVASKEHEAEDYNVDLSGSTICANKPIAVFVGNQQTGIPVIREIHTKDFMTEQLIPVSQWGNEFYLSNLAYTKASYAIYTAAYDSTIIEKTTYNLNNNSKTTIKDTLMRGESGKPLEIRDRRIQEVVLKSNKPILCYHYTLSGTQNSVETPVGDIMLGDPSNALIPAWSHRVKSMNCFTEPLDQQGNDIPQYFYAYIVTKTTDITLMSLDGTPISGNTFKRFESAPDMSYAFVELDTLALYHLLETTGEGFVGTVYALTEGQGYYYTMGFTPPMFRDSLFITNTEAVMDARTYDLERLDNHGWYQRQRDEWTNGRLDRASVCDSTTLYWQVESPADTLHRVDSIHWILTANNTIVEEKDTVIIKGNTVHTWEYYFVLPEEIKDARQPYLEYRMQALLYRTPLFCGDYHVDTLQNNVRVHSMYNDTVWKIVCSGEEFTFFSDTTLASPSQRFKTRFYYEETAEIAALEDTMKYHYKVGLDTISKAYNSFGGCDSLSTLLLYVCESIRDTVDTTLCEKDLELLNTKLGDFFSKGFNTSMNIDFVASFEKRESFGSPWHKEANGSWTFDGTSYLKTFGCRDALLESFIAHNATYDGCDSTLTLHLHVLPTEIRKSEVAFCGSEYVWKDDLGNELETIHRTEENSNKTKLYTHSIQYQNCSDCPAGGCDSVRYELDFMFIVGEQTSDTVYLCQNAGIGTYSHRGHNWTFDPEIQETGVYIHTDTLMALTGEGGCEYNFHYVFYVKPLPAHRDSVVYCYKEGEKVVHQWQGHNSFWYNKKGSSIKTFSGLITADYPKFENGEDRIIYELCDTVRSTTEGACDDVYYQVVIIMPDYNIHTEKHMADVDSHIWANKILAGENADLTAIENPDNLEVVVMKPTGGTYPADWTVNYNPELKEYSVSTLFQTAVIHNAAGDEQTCDSLLTLSLRVGQIFRDTLYTYTCAGKDYYWFEQDTVVTLEDVTSPSEFFYYDSLKTKWPVIGLDSIYVLSLTVFPSFIDTVTEELCQDSLGYQWLDHMGVDRNLFINGVPVDPSWDSIPINEKGHYFVNDNLQTKAREFRHPQLDTLIEANVLCDSIWVLDLTVNEVFNADYTKIQTNRALNSNDTLTFYSPKTLFIGKDFDFGRHGTTEAILLAETGADAVAYVSSDSLFEKKAFSQYNCDSTSYLYIDLCFTRDTIIADTIGDNDTQWFFGGDTTTNSFGVKQHTLPLVLGSEFNVDDDGNEIDYSSRDRVVRTRHYIDTMRTAAGCDSIIDMTLYIFPTYRFDTAATTCHNHSFSWHGKDELHLLVGNDETGVVYVYDSLKSTQSNYHCDSVHVLALTIYPGVIDYLPTKQLCYNDTILWHNRQLFYNEDAPALVKHYFQDPNYECGRELYLPLQYNPAYGYDGASDYNNWVETFEHICQYEEFHWLDANGNEHKQNLRDAAGNKYDAIPTDHVGWYTIYDSLKTSSCGCDSIFTLHYYVDTTYRYFTEENVCTGDTYDWIVNGALYQSYPITALADVLDTIKGQTSFGCDSSYYLYLHVAQSYVIPVDVELCGKTEHFDWNNKSYDAELADSRNWEAPREFFDTIREHTTGAGCDSLICLHLTIYPSKDSIWRDTICETESYTFFGQTLTASGTYTETQLNQYGCDIKFELTLEVLPPTQFEITAEPVCMEKTGANSTYAVHYTFEGEFAPTNYSIRYDEKAKEVGFEDIDHVTITIPSETHVANIEHTLDIAIPNMGANNYPTPGNYTAVISFENGVCDGDRLMRYPYSFTVNYPNWIMEQRHGDVIALLNQDYNGGYTWTSYQWFENNQELVGQTKPYLHIPTGLTPGAEYHVELVRDGETTAFPTCAIQAYANPVPADYQPTMGYLSVTPTCVHSGHPYIYILSRKPGNYRISTVEGMFVSEGTFRSEDANNGATEVQIPAVNGLYIVQLWSKETPEEPYRAIKVIVSDQCVNCSTSSF